MGSLINPHDLAAERALLGILLNAPHLAARCGVNPSDLDPAQSHDVLLTVIRAVHDETGAGDPVLVLDELRRRGRFTERTAPYLAELVAARGAASVGRYALIIRRATARRTAHEYATRAVQVTEGQPDHELMMDNLADLTVGLGMVVNTPAEGDLPIHGLSSVTEFVNEPSPPFAWVIPGVVERADRVMVIAGEGVGKSVLARQVCTLLAAGRHPFAPAVAVRPRRTLLIDLENPPDLVRRSLRGIVGQVWDDGLDLGDRMWRWNNPAGLDLRSVKGRAALDRVVDLVRPDLVALGPIYKAGSSRPGDSYEIVAEDVRQALDGLRDRYGIALWVEHHMPKGEGGQRRGPIGSSLWQRWPEFGIELRRAEDAEPNVYRLDRFRGDRDARCWPDRLIKGASRYPWAADWDDMEQRADLFLACEQDRDDSPHP